MYLKKKEQMQILDAINVEGDSLKISGTAGDKNYSVTVPLSVEMKTNAKNIETALIAAGFKASDITVALSATDTISIEFRGQYTAQYIDMMECTPSRSDLRVNVAMRQTGSEGTEFAVNQTTDNNQRFASIGMQADGTFVVSWTSWGQDLDANTESNIYARRFASNHVVSSTVGTLENQTVAAETGKVITTDPIELNEVYPGQGYDSVCLITVGADSVNGGTSSSTDQNAAATEISSVRS